MTRALLGVAVESVEVVVGFGVVEWVMLRVPDGSKDRERVGSPEPEWVEVRVRVTGFFVAVSVGVMV